MERTPVTCGDLRSRLVHQPPRFLLHLQLPLPPLRRSFSSSTCSPGRGFRKLPLRTELLSLTLDLSRTSSRRSTTNSLSKDAVSATKIVEVDPTVAVKKKATEISPELKGTSIFLVGMNSAMKTSVGKLLADALRYYYFDSDNLVEEASGGESAGKSFRERDKEGFHESETEVLKQLSSMGRLVVCAGNGAVQSSTNLALLRHGLSIWIDVPLDMVASGVSSESSSEVFDQLAVLYEEMRGGYATADATVALHKLASELGYDDFNAVTKEDVALEVLKEIEKLIRVKKMMAEAARPF